MVPDPSHPTWSTYQDKNKFVYSTWVSRIASGLAMSVLREFEDKRYGREAYFKFLETYEDKYNLKQMTLLVLSKLNSMTLGYR